MRNAHHPILLQMSMQLAISWQSQLLKAIEYSKQVDIEFSVQSSFVILSRAVASDLQQIKLLSL